VTLCGSCHISEDGILHSHRSENLKSYKNKKKYLWGVRPEREPVNLIAISGAIV
jgi:hypothetical protein